MGIMAYFKDVIADAVKDARIAVELGVEHGESTRIILDSFDGELYSYDVQPPPDIEAPNWHFSDCGGVIGYERWGNKKIDFLFVDTDPHSYEQTYLWCLTWFKKLKVGGISLWHDTSLVRKGVNVRGALLDFAKYHKADLKFIDEDFGMGIMIRED